MSTTIYTDDDTFWRDVVDKLWLQNDVKPESMKQRNECAAMVKQASLVICAAFQAISKECDDAEGLAVKVALGLGLDRSGGAITDVSAELKASKKWLDAKIECQVAPPESELPLE